MNITVRELKNHLDKYLASSEKGPVIVENPEHKKSVLMSYTMYTRLCSLKKKDEESLRYEEVAFSDEALLAREKLEHAYQQMAKDEVRETEALEWAEATIGDVSDEAR